VANLLTRPLAVSQLFGAGGLPRRRTHNSCIPKKGKQNHAVPLTPAVLALMGDRPRDKDAKTHPFMFSTTDGKRAVLRFQQGKAALDKHVNFAKRPGERRCRRGYCTTYGVPLSPSCSARACGQTFRNASLRMQSQVWKASMTATAIYRKSVTHCTGWPLWCSKSSHRRLPL
jgi:hypothetical protein